MGTTPITPVVNTQTLLYADGSPIEVGDHVKATVEGSEILAMVLDIRPPLQAGLQGGEVGIAWLAVIDPETAVNAAYRVTIRGNGKHLTTMTSAIPSAGLTKVTV